MPRSADEALSRTFAALSDPTRRSILRCLADGEALVTDLSVPFDISLAAVSKHIQVLERAELVRRTVSGREHRLAFDAKGLLPVSKWIAAQRGVWERRLDALEAVLVKRRTAHRKR